MWETLVPGLMKRILESLTAEQRISMGRAVDTEGDSVEEGVSLAHSISSVRDDAEMQCGKRLLDALDYVLGLMGEDEGSNPFR